MKDKKKSCTACLMCPLVFLQCILMFKYFPTLLAFVWEVSITTACFFMPLSVCGIVESPVAYLAHEFLLKIKIYKMITYLCNAHLHK